jgi:hypothetical protein
MDISPRTLVRAMLPSTRRGCVGNIRDPTYIGNPYQMYLYYKTEYKRQ